MRPQVRHKTRERDPWPRQRQQLRRRRAADDLAARVRIGVGDPRPDLLDEPGRAVDIGHIGHQPEKHDGAAVRLRIGGARLVKVDVGGVGDDHGAGRGDIVEQALLVGDAAEIDAVGAAVGAEFFAPQLAPVGFGVQTAERAAAGARVLPRQIVVDVVGVHDQGRDLGAWWCLSQVAMAEEGEFEIDDVESFGAQHLVERLLHLGHHDPQPFEASGRSQRAELQQPLGETVAAVGIFDQHDLAAVRLHRDPAFLDVELVVDQHHGGDVVALRELGHQAMQARLRAKARRARRHLRDIEDIETFQAHGLL